MVNGINSTCPTTVDIRSGYLRHVGIIYSTSNHQTSNQRCSMLQHANSRKCCGNHAWGFLWQWSFLCQGVPYHCALSAHCERLPMRTTWVVRQYRGESPMLHGQLCWAPILGVSKDQKWSSHECLTWLGWSGIVMGGAETQMGKTPPIEATSLQ